MEVEGLDRARINVRWEIVEITWEEREGLLRKIATVAGYETVVAKFHAVGASRPVELNEGEMARLRVPLEFWAQTRGLPDGLARLLAALVRTDPGGQVDTGLLGG
jgi:hypothetical protein